MSGKAKFRLFLLFVMAGLLGYVGYRVYRAQDPLEPYVAAQAKYKECLDLMQGNHYSQAAAKLDEAHVYVEHTLRRLNGPHNLPSKEAVLEMGGKAYYLKALTLRDKHYANAAAQGKPIEEMRDSVTGQSFRSVLAITDSKDREDAIGALRGAAMLLPKNYDAQVDALRMELLLTPLQWDQVEKTIKNILDLKPDDGRALYLLARYEFEQPSVKNSTTPPEKRGLERVQKALNHVTKVRNIEGFPIWRAVYLESQIRRWLMIYYSEKAEERKFFDEMDSLSLLLLDDVAGAVARIRKGEGLHNLSSWDSDAILGIHVMAADLSLEILRKRKIFDYSTLGRIFVDTVDFCQKKIKANDRAFPPQHLIGALLGTMNKSQTILAINKQRDWTSGIETLRPMLTAEFKAGRIDSYHVAQFSELLMREAYLRRSDPKRADELRREARKWLEDGLKLAKDNNLSLAQQMPFNMLAANVAFFTTGKRSEMQPYLQALQETRHPQAQAMSLVLDGAADELEGRLDKARYKLEKAIKIQGGQEELRGHAALANIYMALGQPDAALVSLATLRRVYERYEDLSNLEKEWVSQFLRSPQDVHALTVIAYYDSARQKIQRYFQKNPKARNIPLDLVKETEDKAERIIHLDLPPQTGPGLAARLVQMGYLTMTRRWQQSEKIWQELNRNYADRVDMLHAKVMIIQAAAFESGNPAKIKASVPEIDNLIQEFIKKNPRVQSGKLYYATWLQRTHRDDQALEYLENLTKESGITPAMRRVLSAVVLAHGKNISSHRLVQHLPRNPQIDMALFDLARNVEEQQKVVRASLSRHESVGFGRALEAEEAYQKGDFATAAKAFAQALDFTRLKPFAQQGMIRSLMNLTNKDAEAAYTVAKELQREFPQEPGLLLCMAYIYLAMDEIGSPHDNWESRQSMGSALNIWEILMNRETPASLAVPMTRAEFWFRANRIDVARAEIQRALGQHRQNPSVLTTAILLIVDDPSYEPRPELREYLQDLQKAAPNSSIASFLTARVEEHEGNLNRAISLYEQHLQTFLKDRGAYIRLLDLLDQVGEYDRALKWARKGRELLPKYSRPVIGEIRALCRKQDLVQARKIASTFHDETLARIAKVAEDYKDPDPKKQDKIRSQVKDLSRWEVELEIARAFLLGGAYAEAETRLHAIPKDSHMYVAANMLLGELYVRQKQYAKAEAVYTIAYDRNRSNWLAANALAYVQGVYLDKPAKAMEILTDARKSSRTSRLHSADRFPPEFLDTLGAVYAKLNRPDLGSAMMKDFSLARERYPQDPRMELYWGLGNELAGETREAERSYKRAMQKINYPGISADQRASLLRDADSYTKRIRLKENTPDVP